VKPGADAGTLVDALAMVPRIGQDSAIVAAA
jgi:hypothetical protein